MISKIITKIEDKIIEFKQRRRVRELEIMLGNVNGAFWKSNPTEEQVSTYYGKIKQVYRTSLNNLDQKLSEFRQNPSRETALAFESVYNQGRLYEVWPLEEISSSFDRLSNYKAKGLIGLTEVAEDLKEIDSKSSKKLAQKVYNFGLYLFSPGYSIEEVLKYYFCSSGLFGIALPHVNNLHYPTEVLYSIAKSARLLGKLDELKNALLRVPSIQEFLETKEGEKLQRYLKLNESKLKTK